MALQVYSGLFGVDIPLIVASFSLFVDPLLVGAIALGMLVYWFLPNSWEFEVRDQSVVIARLLILLAIGVTIVLCRLGSPLLYFQF